MTMGLSNTPGTFQRLMDMVLHGLTWTSVLIYIDDIVVYASSHIELRNRLAAVFQRLRDANLKLKPSKVRLFQRQIKFLGNIVSGQGVAVDGSKVTEITQWAVPRNVHEIRMFLGLCSYYRRYFKDFAAHAAPLHIWLSMASSSAMPMLCNVFLTHSPANAFINGSSSEMCRINRT